MPAVSRLVPPALALLVLAGACGMHAANAADADAPTAAPTPAVEQASEPLAEAAKAEAKLAPSEDEDTETGLASWYGHNFNNKRTASGERFNAQALTAAHPTLPFHTWVRVTLLSTGRSVIVRITDRGPYIANRLIDISRAAAAKIGLIHRGSGTVRIEPLAEAPTATLTAPAIR